jgi:hypothetical protein
VTFEPCFARAQPGTNLERGIRGPRPENRILASRKRFIRLALMLRELKFEMLHRPAHTFQHFERNSEFAIARTADCDSRGSSQPLEHAKLALGHVLIVEGRNRWVVLNLRTLPFLTIPTALR